MGESAAFLIVDDHVALARSIARLVHVRECVLAHDVASASAVLRAERSWCGFLIDAVLGEESGLDVLKLARERHPRTPAVLMTGHEDRSFPNRAFLLGGGFLTKPVQAEALHRFVIQALAHEVGLEETLGVRLAELTARCQLSKAEAEILALAARHGRPDLIAETRNVSANTNKTQVKSLLRKLRVETLFEASARLFNDVDY